MKFRMQLQNEKPFVEGMHSYFIYSYSNKQYH
jgi:hypothetical protein